MITVANASFAHGYSGYDHLLNDHGMAAVIGRTFPSLQAAANAAAKAAGKQDRRCAGAPVWIGWIENGCLVANKAWPK